MMTATAKRNGRSGPKAAPKDRPLTPREQLFVAEFQVDYCAGGAYQRAGYRAKNRNVAYVGGFRLLRKPKIREALQAAQQRRIEQAEVTVAEVISNLRRDARPAAEGGAREGSARVRASELLGRHAGMFPTAAGTINNSLTLNQVIVNGVAYDIVPVYPQAEVDRLLETMPTPLMVGLLEWMRGQRVGTVNFSPMQEAPREAPKLIQYREPTPDELQSGMRTSYAAPQPPR
jgi:hypothetical protein